jgi:hypothetical protein
MSFAREAGGDYRDFVSARDADDSDAFGACAFQFGLRGTEHCIDVTGVVARSDDRE